MLDRGYVIFLIIAFLLFVSCPANSQSRLDSIQHIDEVVVTARRVEKEVIPVQMLKGKELQKLSVHSVSDAIRYFSGIQIKDYGGIGGLKTVNIRSMGSQHVGIFYDDVQLGNAQNGIIDLGRFSLDNMESVSVYNGQRSKIFQSARDYGSAGALYLQTKKPAFDSCKTTNLRAKIKTGSFGVFNPSILFEKKLRESLSGSINAEYMHTNGKYKFTYTKKDGYDTTAIRQNGDVEAIRVEYGLNGKLNNNGYWDAKLYFYNSERGYPGACVREEPGRFKNQDRQWDTNIFLQSSFKKSFNKFSTMFKCKYAYDYLHYLSDPELDISTMYINNHYYQHEIYISSANRYFILPFWEVNISTDFQWNLLNADLYGFVYPRRYTGLIALATALHFDRFKIQASILDTYVHEETLTGENAADDKNKLTPTVIASFKPWKTHDFNLRAFYKHIFRMPTLNDLYYTFIGNADLDPEYTTQYNLGMTYSTETSLKHLKNIEIQLDAYYNTVSDKIVAMPTSNQFRWTMVNLGYVEIRGFDLSALNSFNIGNDFLLDARISYTYQKAQDFTDPASNYYGGQIPYIPWHSGSLIINSSYKKWELNYSFIYTGERYESQANIVENYTQPWYTSDLSLSWKTKRNNHDIRLTAEVNNLFNQQYEVVQCYPMPGINYKFIITVTI